MMMTGCLLKRFTTFKGVWCSLQWVKKVPVTVSLYNSACLGMGSIRVSSTADVPRGSHAHNFQLTVSQKHVIFQKFLVLLQSTDKHFFSLL
jgi:hypothetical protein